MPVQVEQGPAGELIPPAAPPLDSVPGDLPADAARVVPRVVATADTSLDAAQSQAPESQAPESGASSRGAKATFADAAKADEPDDANAPDGGDADGGDADGGDSWAGERDW